MLSGEPGWKGRAVETPPASRSRWVIRALVMCGWTAAALVVTVVSSLQTMWLVAPLVGVLVAGLVAVENPDCPTHPAPRRLLVLAGCGGALLVALVDRIVWLGVHGVPVMLVGLAVGALAAALFDADWQGNASAVGRAKASVRS